MHVDANMKTGVDVFLFQYAESTFGLWLEMLNISVPPFQYLMLHTLVLYHLLIGWTDNKLNTLLVCINSPLLFRF